MYESKNTRRRRRVAEHRLRNGVNGSAQNDSLEQVSRHTIYRLMEPRYSPLGQIRENENILSIILLTFC